MILVGLLIALGALVFVPTRHMLWAFPLIPASAAMLCGSSIYGLFSGWDLTIGLIGSLLAITATLVVTYKAAMATLRICHTYPPA